MKNKKLEFEDLQTIDYEEAYRIQKKYFDRNLNLKSLGKTTFNKILFCEHPNVYTLGKHGNSTNLLVPDDFLKKINAKFVKVDRGGDITFHGFGQLVVYPVLDMDNFGLMTKKYVFLLEEVIIKTLQDFGINGFRLENAPGVWIAEEDFYKKICAIGIRTSKGVTMHGFALNVNTDLKYFSYINPCGFTDKGVASMKEVLGYNVDFQEVKNVIKKYFQKIFA